MAARGLPIRGDVSALALRQLAVREVDRGKARRMMAIANALEGMSRAEAARLAGMERQALRDAVVRYNAEGPAGLSDRPRASRRPLLDAEQAAELGRVILGGPDPERDGLSSWTLPELCRVVEARWGKRVHPASLSRIVRRMGFSRQKARPVHPRSDSAAAEAFKKGGSPTRWRRSPLLTPTNASRSGFKTKLG
jgi:transposase